MVSAPLGFPSHGIIQATQSLPGLLGVLEGLSFKMDQPGIYPKVLALVLLSFHIHGSRFNITAGSIPQPGLRHSAGTCA